MNLEMDATERRWDPGLSSGEDDFFSNMLKNHVTMDRYL